MSLDYESTLPPEILQIARDELDEDELRRTDSVLALREWVKISRNSRILKLCQLVRLLCKMLSSDREDETRDCERPAACSARVVINSICACSRGQISAQLSSRMQVQS